MGCNCGKRRKRDTSSRARPTGKSGKTPTVARRTSVVYTQSAARKSTPAEIKAKLRRKSTPAEIKAQLRRKK